MAKFNINDMCKEKVLEAWAIYPWLFVETFWPKIKLYDKQIDIMLSVRDNFQTVVTAGNMLGKDFIAGLITIWFFLTRTPCRIVTTSVDATQLEGVLWGEIGRFIQDSVIPLDSKRGGPLVVNHLHLRKMDVRTKNVCKISYVIGRVAAKGEGMLGHHVANNGDGVPRTLFVADEASGVDDTSDTRADTWAKRKLAIGNPYPCQNFFKKSVTEGDFILNSGKIHRKVIHICGEDSPNVKRGLLEKQKGLTPSNRVVIPGVLPWEDYVLRRETWDPARQCVGIDGKFWEGENDLLFPPQNLDRAERLHAMYVKNGSYPKTRIVKGVGVDPAAGGDDTSFTLVDEWGIIDKIEQKTPDTSVIEDITIKLVVRYNIDPRKFLFDSGGGGKQIVDRLRKRKFKVRLLNFGESLALPIKRGMYEYSEKEGIREERYVYKDKRAELYGIASILLDAVEKGTFAIPSKYTELRRQLSLIPRIYDSEGKLTMLPKWIKHKKSGETDLITLLGRSPDEADSFVLAVYCMLKYGLKSNLVGAWRSNRGI